MTIREQVIETLASYLYPGQTMAVIEAAADEVLHVLGITEEDTTSLPTGHPASCWCHGTGWRSDLNVRCNLPSGEAHPNTMIGRNGG